MAPFSFLLAIARYVQRSSAVSFTILNRVRAASLLETINCHASERARNEKRQKLERRASAEGVCIILSSPFNGRVVIVSSSVILSL